MGIPSNYPGLTPEMVKMIKSRAFNLSSRYGHVAEDREDLEQEMALYLLSVLPKHDPNRSNLTTFANRVIDSWTKMHIRKLRTERRDYSALEFSLDEPRSDEDGERTTLGDVIGECDVTTLAGYGTLGCIDAVELKVAVDQVIATLPRSLRELCIALRDQTVTEASVSLGIPRNTMIYRFGMIREVFEEAGLGNTNSFRQISDSPHI